MGGNNAGQTQGFEIILPLFYQFYYKSRVNVLNMLSDEFTMQNMSYQRQVTSLPAGTYFVRVGKEIKKIIIAK